MADTETEMMPHDTTATPSSNHQCLRDLMLDIKKDLEEMKKMKQELQDLRDFSERNAAVAEKFSGKADSIFNVVDTLSSAFSFKRLWGGSNGVVNGNSCRRPMLTIGEDVIEEEDDDLRL